MAAVINGGSSGGGTILIRIDPGSTLGGTDSNAQITSPANGNILTYDGTNAYWKNTDLAAGTGISVSKSATGVLTVTNSGVTSLTGTASQVTVSASTGGVTLSLPSTINVDTSGNAATVTNGVYTTGSYADPTWITSLAGSKITGTIDGGTF